MPRYASSTDVARLAGVSQSAVSRTYKPGGSVSAETRRKVLAAAEQLGYRPSLIPQIMLNHRSYLVAIVIGGMYNPFYSRGARGVHASSCRRSAIRSCWFTSTAAIRSTPSSRASRATASMRSSARWRSCRRGSADELARFRIPVISFNTPGQERMGVVGLLRQRRRRHGDRRPFPRARRAEVRLHHRPAGSPANEERLAGLPEPARGAWHTDLLYRAGRLPLRGRPATRRSACSEGKTPPDAIFCANDLMAMGAIDAIRQGVGLRVPEDVMIAGFDDIPRRRGSPTT